MRSHASGRRRRRGAPRSVPAGRRCTRRERARVSTAGGGRESAARSTAILRGRAACATRVRRGPSAPAGARTGCIPQRSTAGCGRRRRRPPRQRPPCGARSDTPQPLLANRAATCTARMALRRGHHLLRERRHRRASGGRAPRSPRDRRAARAGHASPCVRIAGTPPASVDTTGRPLANASSTDVGMLSMFGLCT